MKIIKIIILTLSFSYNVYYSQSVYNIEPGTKGNKIVLTIENASTTLGIEELKIVETNNSKYIKIKNKDYRINNIEQEGEKKVEIKFDISETAKCNTKDTLNFQITDGKKGEWNKKIVLKYNPPKEYTLSQNYPNPFNPSTIIKYKIAQNERHELSNVRLVVFDILGREVVTLVNEKQKPGNYEVNFNASNLSSGTYIYRLTCGKYSKTMKLMLLK